jgi:hypothetical protein
MPRFLYIVRFILALLPPQTGAELAEFFGARYETSA